MIITRLYFNKVYCLLALKLAITHNWQFNSSNAFSDIFLVHDNAILKVGNRE